MNEHIQIILGAMSFQNSPCSSEPCRQWRNKDVLEGYFHIIIFWNMTSDRWRYMNGCKWMAKRCIPPRLTVEQCCTWRIISYCHPLKHGYRLTLSHNCIEWMSERHPPRRLIVGQLILKLDERFIACVYVIKAASLIRSRHFFSQSD